MISTCSPEKESDVTRVNGNQKYRCKTQILLTRWDVYCLIQPESEECDKNSAGNPTTMFGCLSAYDFHRFWKMNIFYNDDKATENKNLKRN